MSDPKRGAPVPPRQQRELLNRLDSLSLADAHRLGRRLESLRGQRDPRKRATVLRQLALDIEAAERRADQRALAQPHLVYPHELPISQARDEILGAMRANPVVVLAGETGSGKTTQLPKLLLEVGCGRRGRPPGAGTPSRGGSSRAACPNGWPKRCTPTSASRSATRCGSPTRSEMTASSS